MHTYLCLSVYLYRLLNAVPEQQGGVEEIQGEELSAPQQELVSSLAELYQASQGPGSNRTKNRKSAAPLPSLCHAYFTYL